NDRTSNALATAVDLSGSESPRPRLSCGVISATCWSPRSSRREARGLTRRMASLLRANVQACVLLRLPRAAKRACGETILRDEILPGWLQWHELASKGENCRVSSWRELVRGGGRNEVAQPGDEFRSARICQEPWH